MSEIDAPPTPPTSEGGEPTIAIPHSTTDQADASSESDETAEPAAKELSFDDFDLSEPILRALADVGYEKPMEVQAAVFGPVSEGRDIQVESRTGSGKTAAFGLPILERLNGTERGVGALILAPTRELAKQVADELTRLSVHSDVDVAAVYGGAAMGPQISALESGVKIVAGTPGRVLDHIRRRNLRTDGIKMLVLDECDEMLSMGFAEEIENIVKTLPKKGERQTLLFSATIPDDIVGIANRHLVDPVKISLSKDGIGAAEIDHFYYLVNGMARTRDLLKLILREEPGSAIIFCNTRDDTATVARYLAKNGFDAEAISGDLSQRERERVMNRMRAQNLRFLVATDIAARGIDISGLTHVINYQFPESAEVYVHRTGRTGRAGLAGTALSLVGPREIGSFYYLKLIYKIRPEERDLPPTEELAEMLEKHQFDRVSRLVTEKPNEKFASLAKRVMDSDEGERIIGVLLERLLVAETSVDRDRASKREREESEPRGRTRGRRSERDRDGGRDRERSRDRDRDGGEPRRRRRRRKDGDDDASVTSETEGESAEASATDSGDSGASDQTPSVEASEAPSSVEPTTEANENDSSESSASDDTESTEAKTSADAEDGEERPKRKRRRRRKRSGRSGDSEQSSSSTSSDSGREFWETWADEKTSSDGESDGNSDRESEDSDGERGEKRAARDRDSSNGEQHAAAEDDPNTRLYVNIGKREEATADDIRSLIGGFIGGDDGAEKIASIALRNTHSYVRVPEELVETIIEAAEGQAFKERDILIEKARR